ncbi:hypothetical protein [Martelella sp. FLE1502]
MLCRAAGNRQLANASRHCAFAPEPIRARAFASREIRETASAEHLKMIDALAAGGADGFCPIIVLYIARPKEFYLRAHDIGGSSRQRESLSSRAAHGAGAAFSIENNRTPASGGVASCRGPVRSMASQAGKGFQLKTRR